MRKEYEGETWEKHGEYWMMHDKQGRAIALMLREAQFRGRKTGEGIPKDERRSEEATRTV